jgi:hypothetical protein
LPQREGSITSDALSTAVLRRPAIRSFGLRLIAHAAISAWLASG